jgi:hypothetical protein
VDDINDSIELIKALVRKARSDDSIYFDIIKAIAVVFPEELLPQLNQLVDGPVWGGNLINKKHKNILLDMDIAIPVCCNGAQGYYGSRNIGYTILRVISCRNNILCTNK